MQSEATGTKLNFGHVIFATYLYNISPLMGEEKINCGFTY